MNNGNQKVTDLKITETRGRILFGEANVNGSLVYFSYDKRDDKMTASSLSGDNAHLFFNVCPHNWKYLICGSIAHCIKETVLPKF